MRGRQIIFVAVSLVATLGLTFLFGGKSPSQTLLRTSEIHSPTLRGGVQWPPYVPRKLAVAKPGTLRPVAPDPNAPSGFYDATVTPEKVEALLQQFRKKFVDISYDYAWRNPTVNAEAWKDANGKHVIIYGGMLRHSFMQLEGIAIILAHETGHHKAVEMFPDPGDRSRSNQLSCEGTSDYWATNVGLHILFPDAQTYSRVISLGTEQCYNTLKYGLAVDPSSYAGQLLAKEDQTYCGHPNADCRKDIYLAGAAATKGDKSRIPACYNQVPSGFTSDGNQVEITVLEDILEDPKGFLEAARKSNEEFREQFRKKAEVEKQTEPEKKVEPEKKNSAPGDGGRR